MIVFRRLDDLEAAVTQIAEEDAVIVFPQRLDDRGMLLFNFVHIHDILVVTADADAALIIPVPYAAAAHIYRSPERMAPRVFHLGSFI